MLQPIFDDDKCTLHLTEKYYNLSKTDQAVIAVNLHRRDSFNKVCGNLHKSWCLLKVVTGSL